MSVEFYRESPRKFDSRTLNRKTLNRWTGCKSLTIVGSPPASSSYGPDPSLAMIYTIIIQYDMLLVYYYNII